MTQFLIRSRFRLDDAFVPELAIGWRLAAFLVDYLGRKCSPHRQIQAQASVVMQTWENAFRSVTACATARCSFGRLLAAVGLRRRGLMHLELLLLVVMRLHLLGLLLMAQLHLLHLLLTGVLLGRLLMFRLLLLH